MNLLMIHVARGSATFEVAQCTLAQPLSSPVIRLRNPALKLLAKRNPLPIMSDPREALFLWRFFSRNVRYFRDLIRDPQQSDITGKGFGQLPTARSAGCVQRVQQQRGKSQGPLVQAEKRQRGTPSQKQRPRCGPRQPNLCRFSIESRRFALISGIKFNQLVLKATQCLQFIGLIFARHGII